MGDDRPNSLKPGAFTRREANRDFTAPPAEIYELIRKLRGGKRSFFVQGNTSLLIKGSGRYLPLAGNVRVTRKAFLAYVADLKETAERQEVHRGVKLEIKLSVHGPCYFI